jgi:hypothetical protein
MGPVVAFLLGGIVSYVGKKPINRATRSVIKGAIVAGRSVKGIAHGITEDWEDARAELDAEAERGDVVEQPAGSGVEPPKPSSPSDTRATPSPKS